MEYKLVKSKRRKSIALQVIHGEVIVRVPYAIDFDFVDRLLKSKEKWLKSKIAQQASLRSETIRFESGSIIWLAGERKILSVSYGDKHSIVALDTSIVLTIK